MLITLTRHFLFDTLCNALAGASSSVIETPDNILKYQRIQVFFWSGMSCVFPPRALLLVGRYAAAKAVPVGFCQQCSDKALPLHAAFCPVWAQSSLLLFGLDLRRHFSETDCQVKYLQWCLYSCTCKILCSQLLMLTVFCRVFVPCNLCCVCLRLQEGLSESVVCVEKCTKEKKQTQLFC